MPSTADSPRPCRSGLVEKNGSKIRPSVRGSMPMPSSLDLELPPRRAASVTSRLVAVIVPSSLSNASDAFSTSSWTTWRSRPRSASTATEPAPGIDLEARGRRARSCAADRRLSTMQRVGIEQHRDEPAAAGDMRAAAWSAAVMRCAAVSIRPIASRVSSAERVVLAHRAGLGDHADELVVELVRDAAGDQPEALEPLAGARGLHHTLVGDADVASTTMARRLSIWRSDHLDVGGAGADRDLDRDTRRAARPPERSSPHIRLP